jgi:hypothetical protein
MKNDQSRTVGMGGGLRISARFNVRQEWAEEVLGPLSFCALKRIERRTPCARFATYLRSSIVNRKS